MSLRKTASVDAPHATYRNEAADWDWKVLKVNQPKKKPDERYSTWMVAAKSPNTFGGWEMGDTYCIEVIGFGKLVSCTVEFQSYLHEHGLNITGNHTVIVPGGEA